jgi:hypothetical protein
VTFTNQEPPTKRLLFLTAILLGSPYLELWKVVWFLAMKGCLAMNMPRRERITMNIGSVFTLTLLTSVFCLMTCSNWPKMSRPFTMYGCLCLFGFMLGSVARAEVTFDIYTGTSLYRESELRIEQEGYESVVVNQVQYRTDPWTHFPNVTGNYYGVRLGYFLETKPHVGFELEHLHSKAIYDSGNDPDSVIQHFEVTDGMNFVMFNTVFRIGDHVSEDYPFGSQQLLFRVGVGPTISKPASTIRGENDGYENSGTLAGFAFAGPGAQVAAQVRMFITPWLAYSLECKLTTVVATVPIANGRVTTPLAAGHMVFGVSFVF